MTPADILPLIVALAIMTLLGYFTTDLLCAGQFSSWLTWALAPTVGAGICALIGFIFRRPMFTIEFGLLIALFAAWLLKHGMRGRDVSSLITWRAPLLGLLLAGALGWAVSESMTRVERIPHGGGTDGWAIWSSHARLLYRDGPVWQDHIQNTFHPDYPLLLPWMTARLWRYAGKDVPDMGGVFGVMFALSGVALLAAALAELRGTSMGLLMALVLIGTPLYLVHAIDQEADVPLSIFILGTVALISLYFERAPSRPGVLVLAGFMAGCAGWTKNEGLLFILAVSAVLLVPVIWRRSPTLRRFAAFFLGLMLPLAIIIFFKVTIAPQNDLAMSRHYQEIVEKILDADRYLIILGNILRTSWTFGGWAMQPVIPLAAFIALRGVDRDRLRSLGWLSGFAILALVLAGYSAVYVLTPIDLPSHLDGSLERLLMHLWPSVLLLAGLTALAPKPDGKQLSFIEGATAVAIDE